MNVRIILIPPQILHWSKWYSWTELARHSHIVPVPNSPGVYEVKLEKSERRLTIGQTTDLGKRIKQQLVKGNNHSAGERITANFRKNVRRVRIRWALTDRHVAVEDELHRKHKKRFKGKLPTFTKTT